MKTKLPAVCDSQGRPLNVFVSAGQVSDDIGATAYLNSPPNVDWLLGDRRHDADWFRDSLNDKGIRLCIPSGKQRNKPVKYDKRRCKRRNRIEILFGRLKDWHRMATRDDRGPKVFLSAIALAAIALSLLSVAIALNSPGKFSGSMYAWFCGLTIVFGTGQSVVAWRRGSHGGHNHLCSDPKDHRLGMASLST